MMAEDPDPVGEQGRGYDLALERLHLLPVERESYLFSFPDGQYGVRFEAVR
jgi:hypothetical protein